MIFYGSKGIVNIGLETTPGTLVIPPLDVMEELRKIERALIRANLEARYGPLPEKDTDYGGQHPQALA